MASAQAALVGRDDELAALKRFVAEAAAGDGGALLLTGAPGLGKSVLLDAATAAARDAGTRVVRASGVEFEADIPFAGISQLVLALGDAVGMLPEHRQEVLNAALGLDGAAVERVAVADATLDLVRRAAERESLLLAVDDVMWLDRSSAFVLSFVARRLAGSRVALVAASRPDADEFFERAHLPEMEVRPLPPESAAELLRAQAPDLASAVANRLVAETGGNPLALLELPATMTSGQRAGFEPLPRILPLPRKLAGLFASRVTRLDARARWLLLLAVLDGSGEVAAFRAAADGGVTPLAEAEQSGLISLDRERHRISFRHPLVRSAVVELAGDEERREAHSALARASEGDPERRAWHLAEAADAPDETVAALVADSAASRLRRGDAVGAVTALLRASDLSPDRAERSRRLALAAYVGADVTGGLQRASDLLAAARRGDPTPIDSLIPAMATAYLLLNSEGDVDTAHRVLAGAIEQHLDSGDYDQVAMAEALHTLMTVCWFGAGRPELWRYLEGALARFTPQAPVLLSLCCRIFCDPARTSDEDVAVLDREIATLDSETDPVRIVRTGMAAFFVDRVGECRDAHWRVVHDGRKGGAVTAAIDALIHLSLDDYSAGRWDEALDLSEEGLAICSAHGYRILAWPLHLARALVAAGRGEDAIVFDAAAEMAGWASPRRAQAISHYAGYLRAELALGRDEFDESFRYASEISSPGVLASHVPLGVWSMMMLVEAAARSGHTAEAIAHVEAMERAGVARLSPRLALLVAASRAIVASDDEASQRYAEAVSITGVERWPFDHARVRLAYGEHLRRNGHMRSARDQLEPALDTFDQLGAEPWAEKARRAVRATGRVRTRADQSDAAVLTPQEMQIATLAATGLSNKQIAERLYLSPRTVSGHLYRVFPKLDITSRAALRDALERDPPP